MERDINQGSSAAVYLREKKRCQQSLILQMLGATRPPPRFIRPILKNNKHAIFLDLESFAK